MPERSQSLGPAIEFMIKTRFRGMDERVAEIGFTPAVKEMFEQARVSPEVTWEDTETRERLTTEPALVLVNHPSLMEPIVAISALDRKDDVRMLATTKLTKIVGENTNKHLIPVQLDEDASGSRFFAFLSRQLDTESDSSSQAQINWKATKEAITGLQTGEVIVMCPSGGKLVDTEWSEGVGTMLRLLNRNEEGRRVNVVNVFVEGTSKYDPFYVASKVGRYAGFNPKITIGKARTVEEVMQQYGEIERSELTHRLHQDYLNWSDNLRSEDK